MFEVVPNRQAEDHCKYLLLENGDLSCGLQIPAAAALSSTAGLFSAPHSPFLCIWERKCFIQLYFQRRASFSAREYEFIAVLSDLFG